MLWVIAECMTDGIWFDPDSRSASSWHYGDGKLYVYPMNQCFKDCTTGTLGENVKRTVKAWILVHPSKLLGLRIFSTRKRARMETIYNERIVPCTITYDDGRKPKRKAKRGRA